MTDLDDVLQKRLSRFDDVEEESSKESLDEFSRETIEVAPEALTSLREDISQVETDETGLESMREHFISNPLIEPFAPMVIFTSEGRKYIGGFVQKDELGFITVTMPMLYIEVPIQAEMEETGAGLQLGFQQPYLALDIPDTQEFSYSSLYFLPSDSDKAYRIVEAYADTVQKIMYNSRGIEKPSQEDILALGQTH